MWVSGAGMVARLRVGLSQEFQCEWWLLADPDCSCCAWKQSAASGLGPGCHFWETTMEFLVPGSGLAQARAYGHWGSEPADGKVILFFLLSLLSLHPTLPLKNKTRKSWHVILSKQLRLTIWNKNLKTSYCDTGSDLITTSNIFPWLPHIQMT